MRPVLLVLAVLAVLPAPAHAAPVPCGPPAATTIATGAQTRVVLAPSGRGYLVCTRGRAGAVPLGIGGCRTLQGCGGGREIVRVAGRLVGIATHDAAGTRPDVEVLDARTGLLAAPTDYGLAYYDGTDTRRIAKFILRADGATVVSVRHGTSGTTEIRRSAGCGEQRLDDGPGVAPGSVRVSQAGRISWLRDGVTRTAAACPTVERARRACPAAARLDVLAVGPGVVALDGPGDLLRPIACRGDRRRRAALPLYEELSLVDVAAGDGAIAYVSEACKGGCATFLDIVRVSGGRGGEPFDGAFDAGSLRIAGGRVRWTALGEPASAALGPT